MMTYGDNGKLTLWIGWCPIDISEVDEGSMGYLGKYNHAKLWCESLEYIKNKPRLEILKQEVKYEKPWINILDDFPKGRVITYKGYAYEVVQIDIYLPSCDVMNKPLTEIEFYHAAVQLKPYATTGDEYIGLITINLNVKDNWK